ncbi:MAG: starch-binding protein, partial [Ruminococcus sp.]|nr:starch-binding protein [Ruminococcus sp.]
QAPTTAPTTEPPTEPPTDPVPDDFTVKFTNNFGWDNVYVHAWTSDGTPLTQWPGIAMTNIGDNGFGQDNFEATVPGDTYGIVFTAGENGPQTSDVTDFSAEGWFVHKKYTETKDDGTTVFTALPWGFDPGDDGQTVKFSNNQKWGSVYVHAWSSDGTPLTQWPGIQMTNIGDNGMNEGVDNYEATIPAGTAGICFTAGENGPQTSDVTDLSAEGWYTDGSKDGEGKFIAIPWGSEGGGSQGGGEQGGDSSRTVKFTNNLGWSSVYVHYWTDGGSSSEWPGIQMTDIGENGYDADVHNFEASIPSDAAGIVFTAGTDGPQTTDVTDFSAEGWFVNSSYTTEKDGKTLYNALPWGTDISGGGSQGGGGQGGGSDTYTVKFSCNWGGTMRAYYWAEGNTPVEWNSAPTMNVEQQDNGYGQSVYVIDIPSIYNMVIFQNGSKQTVDINTNSQSTNYFDAGESNGKYNVGTW